MSERKEATQPEVGALRPSAGLGEALLVRTCGRRSKELALNLG